MDTTPTTVSVRRTLDMMCPHCCWAPSSVRFGHTDGGARAEIFFAQLTGATRLQATIPDDDALIRANRASRYELRVPIGEAREAAREAFATTAY
jgi:hypothetical protein